MAHALLYPASAFGKQTAVSNQTTSPAAKTTPAVDVKQAVTATATSSSKKDPELLTEDTKMPETNVGDLRDVVDAINRLCENMTPNYDSKSSDSFDSVETGSQDVPCLSQDVVNLLQDVANFKTNPNVDVVDEYGYFDDIRNKYVDSAWFENNQKAQKVEQANEVKIAQSELTDSDVNEKLSQNIKIEEQVDVAFKKIAAAYKYRDATAIPVNIDSVQIDVSKSDERTERSCDNSQISLPGQMVEVEIASSDIETVLAHCETASEVYYSASSEVSVTSDIETAERIESMLTQDNLMLAENALLIEDIPLAHDNQLFSRDNSLTASEIRSERDCVVSGHVAAMRERFENMTRSNTPSDLFRSFSPSLDRASPVPDLNLKGY